MWRVIARVGFTADQTNRGSIVASAMRNYVAELLANAGFARTKTGTWEAAAIDEATAGAVLAQVLSAVANPHTIPGTGPNNHLKHLWLYIDSDGGPPSPDDVELAGGGDDD